MDFSQQIQTIAFDRQITIATLILLLPLAAFFLLFFFARRLPGRGDKIATGIMGVCFLLAVWLFVDVWSGPQDHIARIKWFAFSSASLSVNFHISILLDHLSTMMLLLVTFISFLVHIYSLEYMKGKRNYSRYYPYLGIFTFSMLGIVLSDNLLITFMFWEMVGFSSYLLIGFWYEKDAAMRAAKKAFLFNRIGDIGFLVGIFFFYTEFNSFELSPIKKFIIESNYNLDADIWITIAGLGIFAGCIGKSAQFPLHVWLPDAMEGPTPVSALIHAATMVAAGVFLLAKTFVFLNLDVLTIIAYIGAITAFFGAIPAMFQNDIKKVLAYSTISQLGYMVMAMGIGAYDASLFHLMTHAFFKAGLFLSAGAIIHAMHHIKDDLFVKGQYKDFDSQDMRLMGGLRKKMPWVFYCYLVCACALMGIPFFSGFLSKEEILIDALHSGSRFYYVIPVLAFGTIFITAFYMTRQILLVFFGDFKLNAVFSQVENSWFYLKEPSWKMRVPLIILALLSLSFAFSFDPFYGGDSWLLKELQIDTPATRWLNEQHLAEFGQSSMAFAGSVLLSVAGILIAWFLVKKAGKTETFMNPAARFFFHNFYFDKVYGRILGAGSFRAARLVTYIDTKIIDGLIHGFTIWTVAFAHLTGWFDRVIIDGLVNLTVFVSSRAGGITRSMQMGKIQAYFTITLIALILFIIWLMI
ncbi:MAG: NADH-quinone oxidoreductase subunit L [Cytophagaceae bacterium]